MSECDIKITSTSEDWLKISETFQSRWNFPNCLAAIDGKHIQITPPPGTEYFNYKNTFSKILLAIALPEYECIYTDIGSNGRMNDSGVWNSSDLCRKIEDNYLNILAPAPLPLGYIRISHVFVGDDAFALNSYMMKPYPQTVINSVSYKTLLRHHWLEEKSCKMLSYYVQFKRPFITDHSLLKDYNLRVYEKNGLETNTTF